ncbi:MAG: response regulator [Ignavibacteriales bacterium]|nr:response regulator [Ignavibacteriales bacterium]
MKKILIVDDEESFRKSLASQLKLKGWAVAEAADGLEGVDMAARHKPDVILSDVHMDNMNGFIMVEELQQYPATASIPVIMMTSAASAAGAWNSDIAVEYLEKPFTIVKLLEIIGKVVKT